MERKKILIATLALSNGGAERVASIWAEQLAEHGYDVSFFVIARQDDEYHLSEKVKVYSCANSIKDFVSKSYLTRYKKIRQVVKGVNPDYIIPFIFSMQLWMMIVSIGLKAKRVETIRTNPWMFKQNYSVYKRIWLQLFYNTAYRIIVQASEQKDWFSKWNQRKCVLIPNPVSDIYTNSYKSDISKHVVNFIAVGRLVAVKNYPMMIDSFAKAAKQYPNIKLHIFGKGEEDYTQTLQNRIDSLGMSDNIFLMGRCSLVHEEYKKNDVFLMSSDYEGLPNALLEAMASRLFCISTNCKTGPSDLIDDGINGILIPVGDKNILTNTIVKVINMSYEERVAMSDAARKKVMTYCSKDNSLNRLCEILK